MKRVLVTTVSALRQVGAVHVTCHGVPLTITRREGDVVCAVVRVCPHDWVVMEPPVLTNSCLVCPMHLATFDAASGAIDNTRGKRIHEGLRTAQVEISQELVLVRLEPAHYLYLFKAWLYRTRHAFAKLARRRGHKRGRG